MVEAAHVVPVFFNAATALLTGAFAFGLLQARRRADTGFLAAFLLLIAANALGSLRYAWPGNSPEQGTIDRMAGALAALDPFFLYAFASVHPARNAFNRSLPLGLVLAGAAGLALSIPVAWNDLGGRGAWEVAWATYTALVYTLVLAHLARRRTPPGELAHPLLLAALTLVVVPAWARAVLSPFPGLSDGSRAAVFVLGLLGGAAVSVLARGRAGDWTWTAAALVLGLVSAYLARPFVDVPAALGGDPGAVVFAGFAEGLTPLATALRWGLFSLLVSAAILRHEVLGLSLSARRSTARVVVGAVVVIVGLAAVFVAGAAGADRYGFTPALVAVLVVALVASTGLRRLADMVAHRVYGLPRAADRGAALEWYRAAAQQAFREGRSPRADPALAELREGLGIDARVAAVAERMAAASPTGPLATGELLLGRYRVVRLLGRGGSGRAFLARDELLGRDVVLKEVAEDGGDPESVALREARLVGSLRHPNVLTLHDVLPRPGGSVLVMEFVAGGSLEQRVASEGRLRGAEALRLLDEVLAGLEAAHGHGIVHRDVKPGNVLLAEDGTAKLADFGLARLRTGMTATEGASVMAGTPEWMAPEQRRGEVATPATDVHAVGLLAERCLEGLPERVDAVVQRALQPDPAQRWPDARAMRGASRQARAPVH